MPAPSSTGTGPTYHPCVTIFEPTLEALNHAAVRYVVVGGVAVVLHGYARFTADLDLVVDLSPTESSKAIEALVALGLQPMNPVDPMSFADETTRARWIEEKGMMVFSLFDPADPLRRVDVFVDNPIDFEQLWARSETVALGTTTARIASIEDLVKMKRISDRPQDRLDIRA